MIGEKGNQIVYSVLFVLFYHSSSLRSQVPRKNEWSLHFNLKLYLLPLNMCKRMHFTILFKFHNQMRCSLRFFES